MIGRSLYQIHRRSPCRRCYGQCPWWLYRRLRRRPARGRARPPDVQWRVKACTRDTDGTVVGNTSVGACGGFADACDETGTRTLTTPTCSNGITVDREQQQACSRDTDGTVVGNTSVGACGGFADACDETGTRTLTTHLFTASPSIRSKEACTPRHRRHRCWQHIRRRLRWLPTHVMNRHTHAHPPVRNGITVDQEQQQACTRDTDGTVISNGPWSRWRVCKCLRRRNCDADEHSL